MKSSTKVTTWTLLTIIGLAVYVIIDLLLIHLRPDYSFIHNAESDYGRGPYSWLMDINFLLRGGLSFTLVKALCDNFPQNERIKKASNFILVWAISSGLLAFFADNPYGYPFHRTGPVHDLLAIIAFFSVLIGVLYLSILLKAEQTWALVGTFLQGISVLCLGFFLVLARVRFGPHTSGGLYEKIFLALVLLWMFIAAIKIQKTPVNLVSNPSNR